MEVLWDNLPCLYAKRECCKNNALTNSRKKTYSFAPSFSGFFFHLYVRYRWTVFSRVILVETITDRILTLAVVSPLLEQQADNPWRTFHQTDTQRHLQVTSSLGINREIM